MQSTDNPRKLVSLSSQRDDRRLLTLVADIEGVHGSKCGKDLANVILYEVVGAGHSKWPMASADQKTKLTRARSGLRSEQYCRTSRRVVGGACSSRMARRIPSPPEGWLLHDSSLAE